MQLERATFDPDGRVYSATAAALMRSLRREALSVAVETRTWCNALFAVAPEDMLRKGDGSAALWKDMRCGCMAVRVMLACS